MCIVYLYICLNLYFFTRFQRKLIYQTLNWKWVSVNIFLVVVVVVLLVDLKMNFVLFCQISQGASCRNHWNRKGQFQLNLSYLLFFCVCFFFIYLLFVCRRRDIFRSAKWMKRRGKGENNRNWRKSRWVCAWDRYITEVTLLSCW